MHLRPRNPRRVAPAQEKVFKMCASKLADSGKHCSDSEDSLDKFGFLEKDKDIVSSEGSVDTDVESGVGEELPQESGDDDAEEAEVAAAEDVEVEGADEDECATGAAAKKPYKKAASGTYTVFDNDYFFISHTPAECRIRLRPRWHDELGGRGFSKTLNPKHFGDERTYILLRAWMLKRAEQGNWRAKKQGRARQFDTDEVNLADSIKALRATDGLLGHEKASEMLKNINPEFVQRMAATGA